MKPSIERMLGALALGVLALSPAIWPACGQTETMPAEPAVVIPTPLPTAIIMPTSTVAPPTPSPTQTPVESVKQDAADVRSLHLFDYDRQAPLGVQEISNAAVTGVRIYDVEYASPKGGTVPAFLVVPNGPGPFPAVILQHGAPSRRGSLLDYAINLAKADVVALLIDAPFARFPTGREGTGPATFTEQDRSQQIQLIVDLRRGVDLITSLPEVDADRVAFIGMSYGASMGGLLAGVENRIKAYVLALGDGGLVENLCNNHGEATTPWGPKYVSTAVSPNVFHHVALVFDQSNDSISGYLNGHSFGEVRGVGKLFGHGSDVNIGRVGDTTVFHDLDNSGGHYFRGLVDDVAIYRRALSPSEIRAIFTAGSAGGTKPPSVSSVDAMISRWPGDGDATDTAGLNPGISRNGVVFSEGKVGQSFNLDGVNDFVGIRGSLDINTGGPYTQRTIDLWFRSSDDVSNRQVLWEEGGYLRGLSIYIDQGHVYVNGWNLPNDDTPPACHLPPDEEARWLAAMEPIEPINYVGHAAPAALFFQGARFDQFITEENAVRFHQAGSEPKKVKWYDSSHSLTEEVMRDQVLWLQEQIGIDSQKFASRAVRPSVDEFFPAWSPDGRRLAFTSERDGIREIYVMDPDGSNQVNLTVSPAADFLPDWSPDGRKIAFVSNRDGPHEVYVMDADGGNQKRLTGGPAVDTSPAWSPDGARIAFVSNRSLNEDIFVMNADGSGQTNVTNSPLFSDLFPDWSPDGSKIAFSSDRDGSADIYVMNADGTDIVRLTSSDAFDAFPDWSPDSDKIAFTSDRDGSADIYVMSTNGTGHVRLTSGDTFDAFPDWSPDGNQIVFTSDRDGNSGIYKMSADGSNQVRVR